METGWGSWTFDDDNGRLLAGVLDKFAEDLRCGDGGSRDLPRKAVLSSLSKIASGVSANDRLFIRAQSAVLTPTRGHYKFS